MSKLRVLVVDDAAVARSLVSQAIREDSALEVVGVAANGEEALKAIPRLEPDLVTLDLMMPVMDGFETLEQLRQRYPDLPVIVLSSLTERGAVATLEALAKGATDYVPKPTASSAEESIALLRESLVPKIKVICAQDEGASLARGGLVAVQTREQQLTTEEPEVVAIGASTGGPVALERLLGTLPKDLSLPILIVQHMPAVFTGPWAERLSARTDLRVRELGTPQPLKAGDVWVARGGVHMRVRRSSEEVIVEQYDAAPENSCRPSVDVLFESVAEVYGSRAVAVVLSGMGNDGLRGSQAVFEAGGVVVAQDRMSSVIWGMPGAVIEAGLAHKVLSPPEIAALLSKWLKAARARREREGT